MADSSQSEINRFPPWQVNAFRPWVTQEISRRKSTYPTPMSAPFVRLTSCLTEPELNYTYFTLGLHGFDGADLDIFDISYNKVEVVGYAYDMKNVDATGKMRKILISADQLSANDVPEYVRNTFGEQGLSDNQLAAIQIERDEEISAQQISNTPINGAHPIPGITGVEVTRRGIGQPVKITVNWQCYNRYQLAYLRHHFLLSGNNVVIEWGHQFSDVQTQKVLDFSDMAAVREHLVKSVINGRAYTLKTFIEPNNGNYDFLAGMVANFNVKFNAQTGIYNCSTDIVTVGEIPWGLSNFNTFIRKELPPENPGSQHPVTFQDFFSENGEFDKMVSANADQPAFVAGNNANWARSKSHINNNATDLSTNVKQNPQDYRFISWNFFTKAIIPRMFGLIRHENVKNEILNFVQFYNTEVAERKNKDIWIGNNEYLRSTDIDTMILVKSGMEIADGFAGAGLFGDNSPESSYRGKLDAGVWLNTGMIRECFLNTDNFGAAMNTILDRMNNATHGFWGLQLFYDEEETVYRVIDLKFTEPKIGYSLYKFNQGENGELLNIDLDSAFPPLLITQMAMFAKFRLDYLRTPDGKLDAESMLKSLPAIGTPSTLIFALNWTNFRDTLEQDLASWRSTGKLSDPSSTTAVTVPYIGVNDGQQNSQAGFAKLATPFDVQGSVKSASVPPMFAGAKTTNVAMAPARNSVVPTAPLPSGLRVNMPPDRDPNNPLRQIGGASTRHNNPGNIKWNDNWKSSEHNGAVKGEKAYGAAGYWAKFPTPEAGFAEVVRVMNMYKAQDRTVADTFKRYYQQENSGLETQESYINDICKGMNCTPDTPMRTLDSTTLAAVVVRRESQTMVSGYDMKKPGKDGKYVPNIASPTTAPIPGNQATNSGNIFAGAIASNQAAADANAGQAAYEAEAKRSSEDITNRYGSPYLPMIALSKSVMLNQITYSGYANPGKPNAFINFPVSTTVELDVLGISGISVGDGFYVDKLPFIFERYGCFQTTTVSESVSDRGWITKLRAVFKMLSMEGNGPDTTPTSG